MMTNSQEAYIKFLHNKIKNSGPKLTFSTSPVVRSLSDPMLNKTTSLRKSSVYLERLQYAKKVEGRLSRNANATGLDQSQSNSRINSAEGTNRKVSGVDSASAN